jgi:DNA-binding transcriptional LysR family regulator
MMKRRDLPLNALRGFESTARLGSVSGAAQELGVSHSAISHQIRKLEEILRTSLFNRQQRPLGLTAKGRLLLTGVSDSFDGLTRATASVADEELEGDLTVSCVPGLGSNWFVPLLGKFLSSYTGLNVHVRTEFWHQSVSYDQVDLAITYGSAEHVGRRVVRLGQSEFFPVCSPRNIKRMTRPTDLTGLTLLHDHSDETWSRWMLEAGIESIDEHRNVYFDSAHMALEAARAGDGIAMGDHPTVQKDLNEGRLVRLFDHAIPAIHPYYIVTPPSELMKPAARALETWIIDQF